ncbi:MAG: BACON domain-containing carbohydrate-binding protein [Prevotella sp.]|nr:BACON domain-containing carbohydrate-binding protein [Prevotella sp.]
MKRYTLCIFVAIFGMLNIQPAEAQQKQDALYVFRNDGKFNAFYYADIERIEYSKVDTLGKEQGDYVVQEIYALDSLFRIPISAIDSVAFVTPETKYKADVVRPDKAMTDYIVASDSVSWFRLSASAPSSVVPKVGDKLLIDNPVKFLPNGFSGLVSKVTQGTAGTTIETEAPALEDFFERLVLKAAAGSEASGATTRGPVNGIDISYAIDEPLDLPTLSGSISPMTTISGDMFKPYDDVAISLEGTLAGTYTLTPIVKDFRAFLYFDIVEGAKMYQYMKMNRTHKISFNASGTFSGNIDVPFTFAKDAVNGVLKDGGKKLTKKIKGFDVDFSFGWFLNGKVTTSWEYYNEHSGTSLSTLSYEGPAYHIPQSKEFYEKASYQLVSDTCASSGWAAGMALSTGVYGKAETKVSCFGREFETEARIEVAARLEEDYGVAISDVVNTAYLESGKIYSVLNAEDNVKRTFYVGANLSAKLNLWKNVDWKPINFSPEVALAKEGLYGAVPNMKSITWDVDKKAPWRGTLTVPLDRSLLFSKKVGLSIYDITDDKNPVQAIDFWKKTEYFSPKTYSQIKEVVEDLEPSRFYKAWPQVKVFGQPIIADKSVEISLGPPMMNIKPKAVEFDENPGYKDIEVVTNVKNTEFTTEAAWLNETKPTWNNEEGRLTVYVPTLPDDTDSRKGYVIGVGYDKEGKELLRDTVTVTQLRPILQASPNPVTFEQKGGTITVTLNTTLAQIEAKIQEGGNLDKFFTMTLNTDNTITVTAQENTTGQELSGNIIVKGTSPGGQKAELNLNVIQKTGTNEQSEMTLSTEQMEFDKNAGTMDFTVHVAGGVSLKTLNTKQKMDSNGKKWLDWVLKDKSDPNNRVYTVSVTENKDGASRTGTIELTAKNDDGTEVIVKTLTVTQNATANEESDLKIKEVNIYAKSNKLDEKADYWTKADFSFRDSNAKIVKNGNKYYVTGTYSKKNDKWGAVEGFDLNGDYMETGDYQIVFFKESSNNKYYLESASIKYHNHGEDNQKNYLVEGTMSITDKKILIESPYGSDHDKYGIECENVQMPGTSRLWKWVDKGSQYELYNLTISDEVWETAIGIEFK